MDVNNKSVGEWCRKGKDDFHGYCHFCGTAIKCDNSGKAQLLQHAKKEKHKQATKHVRSNNQAKFLVTASAPSTSSSSSSNRTSGIKELIIAFGVTKRKALCPWDYIRNQ